jgi:hypothetical protein
MRCILLLVTFFMTMGAQAQNPIRRFFGRMIGGPSYYLPEKLPDQSRLETTNLNIGDYQLYVRQICKKIKNTGDSSFFVPCDCRELPAIERKSLENEFLFISNDNKQAVVINYLKDRKQKFYDLPTRKSGMHRIPPIEIDVHKLNQIRFGKVQADGSLHFRVNDDEGREEVWELKDIEGGKEVTGVNTIVTDGYDHRSTESALALVPRFYQVYNFSMVFQGNKDTAILLPEGKVAVDKLSREFYFDFDKPVFNKKHIVRFKKKRLYAYNRLLQGCENCSPKYLCTGFLYDQYDLQQRRIIEDNWYEFEGENLDIPFPVKHKDAIVTSLRFDGLGCVYPKSICNNDLQSLFLDDKSTRKSLRSRTFYSLMLKHDGAMKFEGHELFADTLKSCIENDLRKNDFYSDRCLIEFRETWNKRYLTEFSESLKYLIKNNDIRRVVFFIAGYNVPYSVAHLQGNALIDDYMTEYKNYRSDTVLFVRVFWPSNDDKTMRFKENGCTIMDDMEPRIGKLYNYITNTAYMVSLSLREVINTLNPSMEVNVVSHSFGAAIAAGTVLHPGPKMKDTLSTELNRFYNQAFRAIPPVSQRTYMFLNAPGMPGIQTFRAMNAASNNNHYFYIGYNENDKVQRRHILWKFPGRPWTGNATTLGCNYNHEADKTKAMLAGMKLDDHFRPYRTSMLKTHDFFCYRQQELFKKAFREYIKASVQPADETVRR